ncbi:DUF7373 family lipoprotein [Nocardia arizonensis]|uniref:DUF7373 family lipoprotein n=1 Tax=Nocardia arizonensis TaxID=1141647 RepID=UPI000A6B3FB9|nr:hypothetical protein [Nocardia arizonensis]
MRSRPAHPGLAMLTTVLLTLGLAGCGTVVEGVPTRVRPDISALDVGNYQTVPRTVGNAKNQRQARARESQRLGDYVIQPAEADPSYTEDAWLLRSHIVLDRKALGSLVINDTFNDVAKDLVAGWVNAEATRADGDAPQRTANIAVLMFPTPEIAKAVGPTLEHDDFTYNRDNQPLTITDFSDTTAHWRPGVSSIGSWTVHGRYVIYIKVVDDTAAPDAAALIGHVVRLLGKQIPALDQFAPTPDADLPRIPLDTDGLLGRTLPSSPDAPFRPEPDGIYTGRGILTLLLHSGPETLARLRGHDVDLVAFGNAVVFRSRTAAGAEGLWRDWQLSKDLDDDQRLVDPPDRVGDAIECIAQYGGTTANKVLAGHLCIMRVDRYVVQSRSKQLPDLYQRMSAQYALLTSG